MRPMSFVETAVRVVALLFVGYFIVLHRVGGVWAFLQNQVVFVLIGVDVCVAAAMNRGGTIVLLRRLFSTIVVTGAAVVVLVALVQSPPFVLIVLFICAFALQVSGCIEGWMEVVGVGLLLPMLLGGVGLVVEQSLGQAHVDWRLRFGVGLVAMVMADSVVGIRRWRHMLRVGQASN